MYAHPKFFSRFVLLMGSMCWLAATSPGTPVWANEVANWNIAALDMVVAGGQNPILASRTLAMMHLAIHDALNAIERRYEPYLYEGHAEPQAAPEAAVAAAAHDVLAGVLPSFGKAEQRTKATGMLESTYTAALAKIPDSIQKNHGLVAGQAAAAAMLRARQPDNALATSQYTPGTAPGRWQPHPNPVPANPALTDPVMAIGNLAAMLPHWGTVTPFMMAIPWQFRLPGPPPLKSEQYARDYNELKRIGGKSSTERTAAQTEIAKYWYESSPQGWSRIARVVSAQRGLDHWDTARLLALVNASIADGYIAGADTRYFYNFWRPITAIRAGDTDENDATAPDLRWESFMNTPPLPDYPSTHSVAGGAAAAVLARVFGTDQVSFSMTSGPPFAEITRSFTSFSQAAQENADSRVYAGIHFRTACQDGVKQGAQIGRRAFAQHLQPYKP
jgi:PAP2 superfamily/Vanadium chloroperoxidase N-terminal domain